MIPDGVEILRMGDGQGNRMVFRLTLPSGRQIFGLPTENIYSGDWDLGPTWNYLIVSDKLYLVDTGRYGMGKGLLEAMEYAGFRPKDLTGILLSHGHEDHDGGLFEVASLTGAPIKAHPIYDRLIRCYPDFSPPGSKASFPASCWHCPMPESFSSVHCLAYHRERETLKVEALVDGDNLENGEITFHHVPGHSPDALAIKVGNEALLVGDTILPDITPHPTREDFFKSLRGILPSEYQDGYQLFGLRAYLNSLKKLLALAESFPELRVLPAHRLYYNERWNHLMLKERIEELVAHHQKRGADLLALFDGEPQTAESLARAYFDPKLLRGFGMFLAINEVQSHLELLAAGGDILLREDGRAEALSHFR
jgi:glyoxylase-like metal-dependent hydrolase (beta-lactamase superfamily II)